MKEGNFWINVYFKIFLKISNFRLKKVLCNSFQKNLKFRRGNDCKIFERILPIPILGNYGQVMEVDRYLIHPEFDLTNGNSWNDVCLLTLKTELEYNENVKCIKLNDKFIEPWGTRCIVSGWGRLQVVLKSIQTCRIYFSRVMFGI